MSYKPAKKNKIIDNNYYSKKIQTTKLIKPQNKSQADYIKSIKNNTITIGYGAAGVGKSLIALFQGIQFINSDSSQIEKIFYIRTNVGMSQEKDLGAMPGGLMAKVMHLAYPVLDNLIQFMPESQAKYLIETGVIEVLPISLIRGRSFSNSFIILDEASNAIPSSIKTFLSRIGENSKMVLIGDPLQKDTNINLQDGLIDAINRLSNLDNVGIIEFTNADIVRHSIIPDILNRYDN